MYKLFNDPFFNTLKYIIRISDGAHIPLDEANTDYVQYLSWLAEGNQPQAAD